ncbi:MAG TPA: bifunctional nuclease family protein [Acidimicrobiia bacterium]
MEDAVPMTVTGVRVELPSNTPIVLLREQAGVRFLPIWVGTVEAMSISSAMEGAEPPRPQTHDLMVSIIEALGAKAVRIVVTELRDSVFFAELVFEQNGEEIVVSSRPSDAIALSVRSGIPVFARQAVLDEAGIEIETETEEEASEEEIERFRAMLEGITVDDFIDPDEAP